MKDHGRYCVIQKYFQQKVTLIVSSNHTYLLFIDGPVLLYRILAKIRVHTNLPVCNQFGKNMHFGVPNLQIRVHAIRMHVN